MHWGEGEGCCAIMKKKATLDCVMCDRPITGKAFLVMSRSCQFEDTENNHMDKAVPENYMVLRSTFGRLHRDVTQDLRISFSCRTLKL